MKSRKDMACEISDGINANLEAMLIPLDNLKVPQFLKILDRNGVEESKEVDLNQSQVLESGEIPTVRIFQA